MSSINITDKNELLEDRESDLIRKCINNDRASQNRFYSLYARKMMTVCFRYSKSREDAEDILSEGFTRVFEQLKTFKGTGSLEGWIRRVIINVAIEKFRKKSIQKVNIDDEGHSVFKDDNENIHSHINAKELLNLIQKLPPVYQMVFNLNVFEGMKHKEIAEILNISEGTSKSNLSDAREWLKKRIENVSLQKEASQ